MSDLTPTYDLDLARSLGRLKRLPAGRPAPELARLLIEIGSYNVADDPIALASLRHGFSQLAASDYALAVLTTVDMSNAARRPSQTHQLAQDIWSQLMQGQGSAMFALVEQSFNRVEDDGFKKIIGQKILELAGGDGGDSLGRRRKTISAARAFAEKAGTGENAGSMDAAPDSLQPK